jgi:hypothetical protein
MRSSAVRCLTRRLKARDPLQDAELARVFQLDSGATFTIHSPPSAQPVDIDFPVASSSKAPPASDYTHPLAQAAPPASDKKPVNPFPRAFQAPLSTPPPPRSGKMLSAAEVQQIQAARLQSSQTNLARQYGVSRGTIARFGFGAKAEGKANRGAMADIKQAETDAVRSRWGPKKW